MVLFELFSCFNWRYYKWCPLYFVLLIRDDLWIKSNFKWKKETYQKALKLLLKEELSFLQTLSQMWPNCLYIRNKIIINKRIVVISVVHVVTIRHESRKWNILSSPPPLVTKSCMDTKEITIKLILNHIASVGNSLSCGWY